MRNALLSFTATLLFTMPAIAADITTNANITDVTVYADRAGITRTAVIDVPAGNHKIQFEGVPHGLYPDSLRAQGSGNNALTFGAISHKIVNQANLAAPREQEINTQIRTLEDQKNIITAEKAAIEKQKAFLDSLMGKAASRSREEIADFNLKPDQWASAAAVISSGFADAEKALVKKDIEIRDIDENISKLKRDLGALRTNSKQTYTITLPVEAKRNTRATVQINYQRGQASWYPVYDARLNTQTGDLEIVQYGEVAQRTGEDWKDINLTLSTARPQRGASLPPLNTMWVNLYEPRKKSARSGYSSNAYESEMASPQSLTMEQDMMDMAEVSAAPMESKMRTAQIDTGGFNAEYKIIGKSDVLADGTQSKLLIGPFDATSTMEVHVKPQLSEDAFLVSKATLGGESPILPGNVSLFSDGNYVGQSRFPLLRPGKDHDLYFGIDDQIEVSRKTLEDKSGESGLLGRDNEKEQHFITAIQNLRKRPVNLVLTESVPVAQNEKIETEILKDHTTAGFEKDIDNKKGIIQWSQTLDAGSKSDIKLGWRVTWPKDTTINGL